MPTNDNKKYTINITASPDGTITIYVFEDDKPIRLIDLPDEVRKKLIAEATPTPKLRPR